MVRSLSHYYHEIRKNAENGSGEERERKERERKEKDAPGWTMLGNVQGGRDYRTTKEMAPDQDKCRKNLLKIATAEMKLPTINGTSIKTADANAETQNCSMDNWMDNKAMLAHTTITNLIISLDVCKTYCLDNIDCKSVSYYGLLGTCHQQYKNSRTANPTYALGYEFLDKVCDDDAEFQQCFMGNWMDNKELLEHTSIINSLISLDECKSKCLNNVDCKSVSYNGLFGTCYQQHKNSETANPTYHLAYEFLDKICDGEVMPELSTLTQTVEATTDADSTDAKTSTESRPPPSTEQEVTTQSIDTQEDITSVGTTSQTTKSITDIPSSVGENVRTTANLLRSSQLIIEQQTQTHESTGSEVVFTAHDRTTQQSPMPTRQKGTVLIENSIEEISTTQATQTQATQGIKTQETHVRTTEPEIQTQTRALHTTDFTTKESENLDLDWEIWTSWTSCYASRESTNDFETMRIKLCSVSDDSREVNRNESCPYSLNGIVGEQQISLCEHISSCDLCNLGSFHFCR
ncbi:hypothetical protein CAPTEDRAFT_193024, partial [Capitella teleta]